MRKSKDRPSGYRILGEKIKESSGAILFKYYDWELWIPKKAVVALPDGSYCCPLWAIETSKSFQTRKDGTAIPTQET